MKYRDLLVACGKELYEINEHLLEKPIRQLSIDTRTLQAGDVYVAIEGASQDGHLFVSEAKNKGAIGLIVSRPVMIDLPQILVKDTTRALGGIAAYWRRQFSIPVIAITGSVGKTTTRNMIVRILIAAFGEAAVLFPEKNFNNHWGLPLVLSRLNPGHRVAVLEMGMNHLEEIRYLMQIANPTVAVITNAGTNHLGLLGSLENIAKAKGEMFEELSSQGVAVMNGEDKFFPYWQGLLKGQKYYCFGLNQGDIHARDIADHDFTLVTPLGEISIKRVLLGKHNVVNALAATAAALSIDCTDLTIIKAGLESVLPERGRLEPMQIFNHVTLLNDVYNGGETSTLASLQVLSDYPSFGRKIAVLGDMSELGDFTLATHEKMGEYLSRFSLDVFVAFGPMMARAYASCSVKEKQHFLTHEEVISYLRAILKDGDVVLLKGSRMMQMEKIAENLLLEL